MRLIDADVLKEELASHFDIELEPVIEKEVLRMIDEQETISVASPKWISVKDRLPEPGSYVLVFTDDHCDYTAHYDGYWWLSGKPALSYKVTHWMPLPEPPKEEA